MNKLELVKNMAEKSGLTIKQSEIALDSFVETIKESLKNGEQVKLAGFGNFKIKERAAREGRNPSTGEPISIPAKTVPVFEISKTLKNILK